MEMSAGKSTALNVDPMLTSPGAGTTVENADQLSTLTAYRLKAGSPMIHSGLNLKSLYGIDVGQTDFYGNALHSITVFNRGAED
jgi:hypothetical protein